MDVTNLPPRVIVTDAASALLAKMQAEHGPVVFHISGGCCDGPGPMCYTAGSVRIGAQDVKMGEADGAEIWAHNSIARLWVASQMILDSAPGGGDGFSLDNGQSEHFVTRARVFNEAEREALGIDAGVPAEGTACVF